MKNTFLFILLTTFFLSCSNGQNDDITGIEVWKNYLNTIGDKENVLNIKTLVTTTIIESDYGTSIMKIYMKYPDKVLQEITYPKNIKITNIYNNNKGIVITPDGRESMDDENILRFKDMGLIFPEFYRNKTDNKISLINSDPAEDKGYYKVNVIVDYDTLIYYINKQDFKVHKIIGNEYSVEVIDSKIIDGILMPTLTKVVQGDIVLKGKRSVEININLEDELFEIE